MIKFVNAKINIGLNIVRKREDGYHDLETVFYPVGLESGMPFQPEAFDDILEVTNSPGNMSGCRFQFMGRQINCEPKKNLVVRAATSFLKTYSERNGDIERFGMFQISLDKHLPDGAGLGGGSADAAFTLATLNEVMGNPLSDGQLHDLAESIGADCAFFLYNKPAFAEGKGEILTPIDVNLKDKYILIVKPDVYISTKEAFAGVTPHEPEFDLRMLPYLPLEKWKDYVVNDFEKSVFPQYPILEKIKDVMYSYGCAYASMSGSGSAIYSIFTEKEKAIEARTYFDSTNAGVWLFGV